MPLLHQDRKISSLSASNVTLHILKQYHDELSITVNEAVKSAY
jgi:hypothetical protein